MKAFWNTGQKKAKNRLRVKDNFRIKLKEKNNKIDTKNGTSPSEFIISHVAYWLLLLPDLPIQQLMNSAFVGY